MELKLEIVSFQKSLMGDGQAHVFDETGGSIGRGRDNAWVLPDPNRYVSTRHAEIDWADGRFRITDVSTNGVFVNGAATALGRDGRAILSDGDRLVLGDYEIAVRLDARAATAAAAKPRPAPPAFGPSAVQTAPDILDVIGKRRTEPRLGSLEIPEDPAAFRPAPPLQAQPPLQARPPQPVPPRPADPPPRLGTPLPPPPPRPAPRPQAPAGPPAGIPDDDDLMAPPSRPPLRPVGRPPVSSPAAPPLAAPPPAAPPPAAPPPIARPLLPDDLDDLLPGGGGTRPPPAATPVPKAVPTTVAASPPRTELPDDLDDLLPSIPAADVLPDGVPLVRPVPGTGNREEPLSPPIVAAPDPPPRPLAAEPSARPAELPAVASDAVTGALADGLGLDPRSLGGIDPRVTATTVGRAARVAALGIAGAIDARNALARAAGIDARELGQDDDNPFLTYRSGEAALRHCLSGATPGQTLDSATQGSVAALTVTATAAAAALDAVLDRLNADGPAGSADQVREIFGAAFLNAYHREMKRSN